MKKLPIGLKTGKTGEIICALDSKHKFIRLGLISYYCEDCLRKNKYGKAKAPGGVKEVPIQGQAKSG